MSTLPTLKEALKTAIHLMNETLSSHAAIFGEEMPVFLENFPHFNEIFKQKQLLISELEKLSVTK